MISEQEYVISAFQKSFQPFRDKGIVIYGLGKNTEALLEAFSEEYDFIGLMDGVRTGDTVYGLPVLNMEEVHKSGAGVILILARAANVSIIYPRIAVDCERYSIPVYDINGVEQHLTVGGAYACPAFYEDHTQEALLEQICEADVVSFDVFDTLLMRRCLEPADVFGLVEREAKRRGLIPLKMSFAKSRILAERVLYPGQPTLEDIYARLVGDTEIPEATADEIRMLELAEEEHQLVPRRSVIALLQRAQNLGKHVCVTSDMYLNGQEIGRLLLQHGVMGLEHIFVSSDAGLSKTEGLFEVLKQAYPGKRILHIGDNLSSDIRAAQMSGICAWLVPSARHMLAESSFAWLTEYSRDLPERIILGQFLAYELNDPFLFAETHGKLYLDKAYDLGRYFSGPMVAGFVTWLIEQCQEDGIEMLLLGARDGWVIKEILDDISRCRVLPFSYRYIYVSRAACTPAGVENEADVQYAAGLAWDGTIEDLLKHRFLLPEEAILLREEGETKEECIHRHVPAILGRQVLLQERYRRYLAREGIHSGMRIGFFDFVSSGTCQFWLEKILGQSMAGYYFLRIKEPYKEKLSIKTYYESSDVVYQASKCHLMDNYFFMENIISSPESTLAEVGDKELRFTRETRTQEQLRVLLVIQQGIRDAARNLQFLYPCRKLSDEILNLVRQETCELKLDYLLRGTLEDEFCNRKFRFETML